jgi:hypothetical protein
MMSMMVAASTDGTANRRNGDSGERRAAVNGKYQYKVSAEAHERLLAH